ncbi:MAG: T9SS type A sorting domain-containing protein [Cyanothece sp. SIO1E1]|nr:T9SS type A sorting domain-containing protein [Cyanothece sp. SIO1E1]
MRKNLIVLFSLLCSSYIQAQMASPSVIAPSGGTYQGTNMQLDWTLGELAVTTIGHSTGQITQGFHQPAYLITSIQELTKDIGQFSVFPNPTANQLQIQLQFDILRKIKLDLLQPDGRILWTKRFQEKQLEITEDLSHLPNGAYFLRFSVDEAQYHKTLIIQKLH